MYFTQMLRQFILFVTHVVRVVLTRTTVEGLENMPSEGPVILAPNHMSNFDPFFLALYMPKGTQIAGDEDMKRYGLWGKIIQVIDPLTIKKGEAGFIGIKALRQHLDAGGILVIYPEGATWEKRLSDVKAGTAYLAVQTNAKIIPVAVGGTYHLLPRLIGLRFPRITVRIGEPIDVTVYKQGTRRVSRQKLEEITTLMMQRIFDMLPPADQRRYTEAGYLTFSAKVEVMPPVMETTHLSGLETLAELASKPNLFGSYKNAPQVHPLRPGSKRYVPAYQMVQATETLLEAYGNGMQQYLAERLGKEKAGQVKLDLEELHAFAREGMKHDVALRFVPGGRLLPDAG